MIYDINVGRFTCPVAFFRHIYVLESWVDCIVDVIVKSLSCLNSKASLQKLPQHDRRSFLIAHYYCTFVSACWPRLLVGHNTSALYFTVPSGHYFEPYISCSTLAIAFF